ncbi:MULTISPECIES: hypothetical protein [unclassified Sphingomonas]|uniref:hypothetical protein n=1 Tax=unclassified Sphingomonas TaxID=196159 RepID=UPI0006F235E5|nr:MULTISPECIES: hypothetical protein [unclassified Sphingomonas]KQM58805.1 hypothetical protein ASE65_10600 [Sphingomonas sp. Leaf16]KQN11060.1 hypothetical protein ASE81_11585 [Sphingomonas sp. Leaf29]KQN18361.1 hypothetical protein ASE83_11520 [Sphingomonas sp. Leaf32]
MTDDLVGRHRAALIEAGREAGAFLADDVSDDFLLYVPGEVKGRIAKLTACIEALEAALRNVAAHATGGAIQNGHTLSINDICVQISAHHNRIWNAALAKDHPHAD